MELFNLSTFQLFNFSTYRQVAWSVDTHTRRATGAGSRLHGPAGPRGIHAAGQWMVLPFASARAFQIGYFRSLESGRRKFL